MNWLATWIEHLELPTKIMGSLAAIGAMFMLIPRFFRKIRALYRAIMAGIEIPDRIESLEKRVDHWGQKLERGILNQILTRRVLLDREQSSAFCEFDSTGGCLWVSRLFKNVTGLDAADAKGNGWILGIHPDEQRAIVDEWRAAVREQRGFERTITYIDREGNTCPMKVYGSPLVNEETNELLSYAMHSLK